MESTYVSLDWNALVYYAAKGGLYEEILHYE